MKSGKVKITAILVALATCASPGGFWAWARQATAAIMGGTYYVSPSGSASNDGTENSPWPSVAYALGKVGGGNTIVLEPGTYAPFHVPRGYGGTSDHPTVIKSLNKWQAVIDGTNYPTREGVSSESNWQKDPIHYNTNYVTFDGLKVVNAGRIGMNLGGNRNVVENCWVTGSKLSGIGEFGHKGTIIRNNLIENNGTSTQLDHGIYASGRGLVVSGNVVRHNSAYGMQLYPHFRNSTVSGNLVYGQESHKDVVFSGANNTVTNNILLDCDSKNSGRACFGGIDIYGSNPFANWSGNVVDPAISGASLEDIQSNNVADYSAALAAILPRSSAAPNQNPMGNVFDSGPWVGQDVWVRYSDSQPLDLSRFGPSNVVIKGPGGYIAAAQSVVYMLVKDSRTVVVTYRLAVPKGGWTSANNGDYSAFLQANQVGDLSGNYAPSGRMSNKFTIAIPANRPSLPSRSPAATIPEYSRPSQQPLSK